MGTWGTAIFADDFASDIRGDWREALEDGLDAAAATAHLVEKYGASGATDDVDDGPTFWIALAAAQAATGRLRPEIRDRALELIDAGGDVSRFAIESEALGRKRALALAGLADALRGPQREPTVIKRPAPRPSPAAVGDLVAVRGSGSRHRVVYFLVIGVTDAWPRGSTAPEMVGLLWTEPRMPSVEEAGRAPFLRSRPNPNNPIQDGERIDCYMVQGPTRGRNAFKNFAEVVGSGISRPDAPVPSRCRYLLTLWRNLAAQVDGEWFAEKYGLDKRASTARRLRLPRSR